MTTKHLTIFTLCAIAAIIGLANSTFSSIPSPSPASTREPSSNASEEEPSQPKNPSSGRNLSQSLPPSNTYKGLPQITALPTRVAKVFKSKYPNSNEGELDRIALDLNAPTIVEVDLPQGTPAFSVWRAVGPVKGLVLQDEMEPAVGDIQGLITHLTRNAHNDREKALALFEFVRDDIQDWWYPAMRGDLSVADLNQLIWTFGYGYCYDVSRLVAGLWAKAGLRSRIVSYTKHTVAEVYYDESWHLFDGQHHSYYLKPDGQVASFSELKANNELFNQGLNEYGLDRIGYPPHHMTQWYGEWNPKFEDSQDQEYWKSEADYAINLRKGEFIDITYAEPGPAYHPDSWVIYYGLGTNRKDPPSPYKGKICYSPTRYTREKAPMPWKQVTSPNGGKGWMLEMTSPFLFSEGFLEIPSGAYIPHGWLIVNGQTTDLGTVPHGKIHLSKHIAGATRFQVILEIPPEQTIEQAHLTEANVEVLINLSHIGLPKLREGKNRLPIRFTEGTPHVTAWFKQNAADLTVTKLTTVPEHPSPGTNTKLIFTVTNKGSGTSRPTALTVFNNVTAFLSETTQQLGTQTIPEIEPGQSTQVTLSWDASTEMTWYGQNPYVQLIDAWLDIERDQVDNNPTNNSFQQYILLQKEDGSLPKPPYNHISEGY